MLLIDCREPKSIIEILEPKIPIKILKLKYGDYSFSDVVIERKTLSDFFSSIKNNRLKEQAESIDRFYNEKYLLLEGFFDFTYVTNIDYLYSILNHIVIDFNIRILLTKDAEKSADIIKNMYSLKDLGYNLHLTKRDKIYHATKFFEISKRKLAILYSNLGNLKNILNADKKELLRVNSIGKKTVEKFNDVSNMNIFL